MIIDAELKVSRDLARQVRAGALSEEDRAAIIASQLAAQFGGELVDILPIEERADKMSEPGDTRVHLNIYVFTFKEMQKLWELLSAPGACEPKTLKKVQKILFEL